ncbi:MAG: AAA family ATPase [Candidatus Peribacteraceae bacterium]|nr:AAA family ATPase [Candidatus Peribacteraceae bacterium]
MRLQSFRIRNYKSIQDSGYCRLPDTDNVLVLAGQNESGKSSVLQALYDFERGEMREDAVCVTDSEPVYPIVECVYAIEKDENLVENIQEELDEFPDVYHEIFSKAGTVTFIRTFTAEDESELGFDSEFTKRIEAITPSVSVETADEGTAPEAESSTAPTEKVPASEIAEALFRYTPKVIFFDDFCDLLPDKILISDLKNKKTDARGYNAVKNIETLLKVDLTSLDSLSDATSAARQQKLNKMITANFNERWKQRIFEDNEYRIEIQHKQGKGQTPAPYLNFFVLTKEGEYLTPAQRSTGLRWFLSFYLELKAKSLDSDKLIILFDEPGLYLHSKAQNDIKGLFEELGLKDQIIYSTHSPYLIDTAKLNRVRLIVNDESAGTTVEKITTMKVPDQKDALKPIIDALGLEIAHGFTPVKKKNVILEGISDFNYFTAMKKLLGYNGDYCFVPSMGAPNVHLLMELCTGWGLEWLIAFDEDAAAKKAYGQIKKSFFDDKEEEAKEKIFFMEGLEGIEDAFTGGDLQLVESEAKFPEGTKKSQKVQEYGGKELFSRKFLEKVNEGAITKENISKTAQKNFEKAFHFIEVKFGSGDADGVVKEALDKAVASVLAKESAQTTPLVPKV